MKLSLLLCFTLLLAVAFVSANAKIIKHPVSQDLLIKEYKALIAEKNACHASLAKAVADLDAEKTIQKRDMTEINIIRRLIGHTQRLVHDRHTEKSVLKSLLHRLLARLLAQRKKNKNNHVPYHKKVVVLRDHCKSKGKEVSKARKGLQETRNAEKNQKTVSASLKSCTGSLKSCYAKAKAETKTKAGLKKKIANYERYHNAKTAAHDTCKRALGTQTNFHKKEVVITKKLTNSKSAADAAKKACDKNLATSTYNHATCEKEVALCNKLVESARSSIEGQAQANKQCSVETNHCNVSHAKHTAKCEATADKAEDLSKNLVKCQADLKTCTPKMIASTNTLNKCRKDKSEYSQKLAFITKKHKEVADELEKFRPLTAVPDTPIIAPTPIIKRRDDIPAPSGGILRCSSTGDPHVTNYARSYFHVYNRFNVYTLAHYKHVLNVQTYIRRSRRYGVRGLNSDVAIGSHSNIITFIKYKLRVNGKLANIGIGKVLAARDGVVVKRTGSMSYQVLTPEGAYVTMSQHNIGESWAYSNVYVGMPANYAKETKGICAPLSTAAAYKNIDSTLVPTAARLFGKTFHVPAFTVVKGNELHDKLPWKTQALKDQAYAYCGKLNLPARQTLDCLIDAKVGGTVDAAKTYSGVLDIINIDRKLTTAELTNPAGQTLRELTRLKTIYGLELTRLTLLSKKLTGLKDATIAKDVAALLARIKRESAFLTNLQTVFGKALLKSLK